MMDEVVVAGNYPEFPDSSIGVLRGYNSWSKK